MYGYCSGGAEIDGNQRIVRGRAYEKKIQFGDSLTAATRRPRRRAPIPFDAICQKSPPVLFRTRGKREKERTRKTFPCVEIVWGENRCATTLPTNYSPWNSSELFLRYFTSPIVMHPHSLLSILPGVRKRSIRTLFPRELWKKLRRTHTHHIVEIGLSRNKDARARSSERRNSTNESR